MYFLSAVATVVSGVYRCMWLLCTGVHLVTMATLILLEVLVMHVTAIHKVQLVEIVTQSPANVTVLKALEAEHVTSVSLDMQSLMVSANVRVCCLCVQVL